MKKMEYLSLGGLFVALHVVFILLSRFLPGSALLLVIFLPLLSAIYTLKFSKKEVAMFVAEKLATLENVVSTSTHFVLKKYKDNGVAFDTVEKETIEERGNTN